MNKKFTLSAIILLCVVGYFALSDMRERGPQTPLEWAYSQVGVNLADAITMDYVHSEPNGYDGETDVWVEENGWCGFFVSWCLQKSGYRAPGHPMSSGSWKETGIPITDINDAKPGDVVLIAGHVAFIYSIDFDNGTIVILGGNQEYLGGPPAGVNFMPITFADVIWIIRPVKVQDHPGHK